MRVFRSALVVFGIFAVSLYVVIPAEDVPETTYDESEALPYEGTPPFSIMGEESALVPKSTFSAQPPIGTIGKLLGQKSQGKTHPICDSVTILDRSLRC